MSTDEQAREGASLDAQEGKVRAYCIIHDLELVGIYSDPGISVKSAINRPGLQSALKACDQGAVLIIYSMSRISRSTVDMLTIADRVRLAGSDFVSLSESIDTTSPARPAVFHPDGGTGPVRARAAPGASAHGYRAQALEE